MAIPLCTCVIIKGKILRKIQILNNVTHLHNNNEDDIEENKDNKYSYAPA
jgi:hypothetical protein